MMEDQGIPEWKEEPAGAVGVEEHSVAEDPQGHAGGDVTTDQGAAGGTRKPGRVERPRVSGVAEGGRSQVNGARQSEVVRGLRRSHKIQSLRH